MKYYFIIILFILLVAGAVFVYRDKIISMIFPQKYQIVEIRDFSCPGMSGFTFKYPVFKSGIPPTGSLVV